MRYKWMKTAKDRRVLVVRDMADVCVNCKRHVLSPLTRRPIHRWSWFLQDTKFQEKRSWTKSYAEVRAANYIRLENREYLNRHDFGVSPASPDHIDLRRATGGLWSDCRPHHIWAQIVGLLAKARKWHTFEELDEKPRNKRKERKQASAALKERVLLLRGHDGPSNKARGSAELKSALAVCLDARQQSPGQYFRIASCLIGVCPRVQMTVCRVVT